MVRLTSARADRRAIVVSLFHGLWRSGVNSTVEQIIDVPVPQVVEEIVQVVQITHQERFSEGIFVDYISAVDRVLLN